MANNYMDTTLTEILNIGKPLILQKTIFHFLYQEISNLDFYHLIDLEEKMMIYIVLKQILNFRKGLMIITWFMVMI